MFSIVSLFALTTAAFPGPRVAVLVDDPQPNTPTRARIEQILQERGFEVVDAETTQRIRSVVAPKDVLDSRLPEGLGVLEADALLGGAASYGPETKFEGVESQSVSVTLRLVDLATGRATRTVTSEATGLGVMGRNNAAKDAVAKSFDDKSFTEALGSLGQSAGSVTLIAKDIPDRDALLTLKRGLERALAGAPVKEIYFSKGLGKLLLGGSDAKVLAGPEVADILGETRTLALEVEEVANTRIVAQYKPSRAVRISALVLEPKMPSKMKASAAELGRYLATHFATFEFAKASYQPGVMNRAAALEQARRTGADVVVESEVVEVGGSKALAIRVVDVKSGEPVLREQKPITNDSLETAQALLANVGEALPKRLLPKEPVVIEPATNPTAQKP